MKTRLISKFLWLPLALLLVGMAYFVGVLPKTDESAQSASSTSQSGPAFELTSHKGQPVSNEALAGKPYLAFFGFTNCPDICPTTLFELTDLMDELGPVSDRFNVVLISVDPERDTQERLAKYMTAFDNRILALRGTLAQTEAALKTFGAKARKVPTAGDNYTMDHTAGVFLIDSRGNRAGVLDMHEPRNIRLEKLRNLVSKSNA